MKTVLCLLSVLGLTLHAQVPPPGLKLWLRADSLVVRNTLGNVQSWGNIVDGRTATVPSTSSAVTVGHLQGQSCLVFDGSGFVVAPSVMPVGSDYTVVVVARVANFAATNNLVSGESRALWLAGSAFPRVLHGGDFSNQSVSSVGVEGASIIRVRYNVASGVARISVNNRLGAADVVPLNSDSTIQIGAYRRGNYFSGQIAEVLVFDVELDDANQVLLDEYLHDRYGIPRAMDPKPKVVELHRMPPNLMVATCGDSIAIAGRVTRGGVRAVTVSVESNDANVVYFSKTTPQQGDTFRVTFAIEGDLRRYDAVVTADTGGATLDTIAVSRNIVCGEVIAISGQSNSIYGANGLQASAYARTFGGNASSNRSDTLFSQSRAQESGGGANVGAFGLYLQNAIADRMRQATLVINGGVGGTTIQQHLPDPANRLNRSTLYGSWLYRIVKSQSRERIKWLFWYQGESNGGNDDYTELFHQLYYAWHEDLPNLRHIVVVQIRPGCGPEGHAAIRDAQRQLEDRYPDVVVHAAAALPSHDGCHYDREGYTTLGAQLYDMYSRTSLMSQPGRVAVSPTISHVDCVDDDCRNVRVVMKRWEGVSARITPDTMVGGAVRTARDAFFADGDPAVRPTTVATHESGIDLRFDSPIRRLSYVPDKYYHGSAVVFQGPWLVNGQGVGALTFHNVDVVPTSVQLDESRSEYREDVIMSLQGVIVGRTDTDLHQCPSGVYLRLHAGKVRRVLHVR